MSRKSASSNDPTPRGALFAEGTSALAWVLDTLSERDAAIITLRFGIIDGRPWSLGEIAHLHGISPRQVRRIEAKILRKLRHPSRIDRLVVKDGQEWLGFIDARFGRQSSSRDDSRVCSYCQERWFDLRSNGFTGGRTRQYCSDKCRQAAYRTRRKKEQEQQREPMEGDGCVKD